MQTGSLQGRNELEGGDRRKERTKGLGRVHLEVFCWLSRRSVGSLGWLHWPDAEK